MEKRTKHTKSKQWVVYTAHSMWSMAMGLDNTECGMLCDVMCRLLLCSKVDNILWIYTREYCFECDVTTIISLHGRNERNNNGFTPHSSRVVRARSLDWHCVYWQSCDGKISFSPNTRRQVFAMQSKYFTLNYVSLRSFAKFFFFVFEQLIGCEKEIRKRKTFRAAEARDCRPPKWEKRREKKCGKH